MQGYWQNVLQTRIRRRQALARSSAVAGAAVFLAACGDGDDGGSSPAATGGSPSSTGSSSTGSASTGSSAPSGLLATAEDTTSQGRVGGTLLEHLSGDIGTFDPLSSNNNPLSSTAQSRLVMGVPTALKPYDGTIEGDLAESWEVSADGLQWTWKLRPNAKFQNLPGGVSRKVDAQDIVWNYERYLTVGEYRAAMANQLSAAGPITSVEAPDDETVVMNLAFPGPMAQLFMEHLYIVPREAEDQYDPQTQIIGSGPWIMDEYVPSASLSYRRNPEWHFEGRPFVERIERPIIPEYATRLAQFRAHRIHANIVQADDVLVTKQDLPELNMFAMGYRTVGYWQYVFGLKPDSPFQDIRLRQAASMAIDRDAMISVLDNPQAFRDQGIDVGERWYTHLGLTPDKYWLDPKGSDFGPSAKYFNFDPAEAMALQSAAGFPDGIQTKFIDQAGGQLRPQLEISLNMFRETLGWDIELETLVAERGPTVSILDTKGDFDGMSWTQYTMKADPTLYLFHKYHSNGSSLRVPEHVDDEMDAGFSALFQELDDEQRVAKWHDMQRYLAEKQWLVVFPGGSEYFDLAWPELKNHGVFRTSAFDVTATEVHGRKYWLDA